MLAVITVFQITDAFTIKVDLFLATQKCMIKSQEFTLYIPEHVLVLQHLNFHCFLCL